MLRRAFSSATRIVAVGEAEQAIAAKLAASFAAAKAISVQDTSGGCGAMYNIIVESDDFKCVVDNTYFADGCMMGVRNGQEQWSASLCSELCRGKSIIQQHQAVHRVLKEDIAKWHALNLVTRVPTDS
ncbi:hypothetical protein QJQ45_010182 [Haematococcus lacustris]|nr:hypothetical protein QJQ45_010182 [Haematococcus lacustris]